LKDGPSLLKYMRQQKLSLKQKQAEKQERRNSYIRFDDLAYTLRHGKDSGFSLKKETMIQLLTLLPDLDLVSLIIKHLDYLHSDSFWKKIYVTIYLYFICILSGGLCIWYNLSWRRHCLQNPKTWEIVLDFCGI